MVTFTDRVAQIATVEDAEEQIRLAKNYVKRLRLAAKKDGSLEDKLRLQQDVKAAERVLRQLRRAIFDIEDAIAEGKPATSILEAVSV